MAGVPTATRCGPCVCEQLPRGGGPGQGHGGLTSWNGSKREGGCRKRGREESVQGQSTTWGFPVPEAPHGGGGLGSSLNPSPPAKEAGAAQPPCLATLHLLQVSCHGDTCYGQVSKDSRGLWLSHSSGLHFHTAQERTFWSPRLGASVPSHGERVTMEADSTLGGSPLILGSHGPGHGTHGTKAQGSLSTAGT